MDTDNPLGADDWTTLALDAGHWPTRHARHEPLLPTPTLDLDHGGLRAWLSGLALSWGRLVSPHDIAEERKRAEATARRALGKAPDIATVKTKALELAEPPRTLAGDALPYPLPQYRRLLVCLATLWLAEECP